MNITTNSNGKISRENYLKALKAMNRIRSLKIEALHQLKQNRSLTKHMPQSAFSQAVNGIKKNIKDDDLIIEQWKEHYRKQFQSEPVQIFEEVLHKATEVLAAAEMYVVDATTRRSSKQAEGLLADMRAIAAKIKESLQGKQ